MNDNLTKIEFADFEYDQIERIDKISKLVLENRNESGPKDWIKFMNRDCYPEMIYVPINLLMYRLENGRTLSLQDEYIAVNQDVPEDFFTRDSNSPEAQYAQHTLLMKLNETKDIVKTFRDINNVQDESLIITNTGFVVNGNRRLSCWRQLFYEDKKTYKHFEYVRVSVLPEADENAIEKLEADLQIAPEIKEDYLWHAEARMIQRRIERLGEDIEKVVAPLYRLKRKDVEHRLEMLHYASEYLKRNNWDRQWSKLDKDLHAFDQLVKERKKIIEPVEKSLFESLTYASITTGASELTEGRIYAKVPEIRKHLMPIVEAIVSEMPDIVVEDAIGDDFNLLIDDYSDNEDNITFIAQSLVNLTVEDQKKVAEITDEIIADENAKEKERKNTNYLIFQVKKAAEALENAIEASDEENIVVTGLSKHLDTIEKRTMQLRDWLSEYEDCS